MYGAFVEKTFWMSEDLETLTLKIEELTGFDRDDIDFPTYIQPFKYTQDQIFELLGKVQGSKTAIA